MGRRHLLRDVFWLSLPVVALLLYHTVTSITSFYNGEIASFHGHLLGSERAGGLGGIVRYNERALFQQRGKRYLPDLALTDSPVRILDLRVRGSEQDALDSAVPASAKTWRPATLVEGGQLVPVEVRYRGQVLDKFFYDVKNWKIKTKRRGLVDEFRLISLAKARGRLHSHLSFLVGRRAGLPVPRTRFVRLFLNKEDQGLYLQEEQIDESMIRRTGRMPGDVFFGEIFPSEEPDLSADGLFWNAYLWEKRDSFNRYDEEYRPYLCELIDHVCDDSPESFDRLYRLLDMDEYPLYFAVLSFQGDQHVDDNHNHKLYFSPLNGRFEGILWNPMLSMPPGDGVETMLCRLFRKLARDPRFLDRVQQLVYEKLYRGHATALQVEELDRVMNTYGQFTLDPRGFEKAVRTARRMVESRGKTVEEMLKRAEVSFATAPANDGVALTAFAEAVASLRLDEVVLTGPAEGIRLVEDRDFDGRLSPADRELKVQADDRRLCIQTEDALLYTGRDFGAPYHNMADAGSEAFAAVRGYTRLAALESRFLLIAEHAAPVPDVERLNVSRTVGPWPVRVRQGPPQGLIATETVHPWSLPAPPKPKTYRFQGVVDLTEDLVVQENDSLQVAPQTEFRLGPGVSILTRAKVRLQGVKFRPLDSRRPWGVVAIQGPAASGSQLINCEMSGGSEDTLDYVYYSGMISVHEADGVVLKDSVFSNNLLGDDTVRFARCRDLRIEGVRVSDANGDAIDCDISTGVIVDTQVRHSRNDGIDLMTAKVDLHDVVIDHAGDKGISFGEDADPNVIDCRITNSVMGLGIKDGSDPAVRRTRIEACRVAVNGYDKNWRYPGGGKGRLIDCTLAGNDVDVRLDALSRLTMERCVTQGKIELSPGGAADRLQQIQPIGPNGKP